ncbi:MAG TPA: head GIN domain-containing protein [Chitinophagaceae bacterium]|nr:head GIN domain-containing protein [Chitinophagaceae bacterium]
MKKYILSACAVIISGLVIAQKTINDPNAVTRNVSSFHAIEIEDGIDLYLTQGNEALAVSAINEEVRNKITTKVEDGILKIYCSRPGITLDRGNKKMKVYVSFKTLDNLHASGGSDVYADEGISAPQLTIHLSGGSDFRGKVKSNKLQMEASGGSDIYVSGTAVSLTINASGGSDFHGYDLIADNCEVNASGGSDVNITCNKELNVNASGGSDVYYKGNGSIKNMNSGGSSSVKKVS